MRLKALTTFFLVFGIFLAMGFPWLVGAKPHDKVALEHYLVRFGIYLIVALLCFVSAAICALLLIRRTREQYRAESRQNLEDLIESALKSHEVPKSHE